MSARVWRVALASLPFAWCCALPASSADRFSGVREYIRTELVQRSIPSVVVAVAQDGKIVWEEGFGWADRERRIPATAHTLYSLASISKPITATGLMTLVQAGQIDLDRPANDYLGSAKLQVRIGNASDVTVRRLANHTSGLPTYHRFFYVDEPYVCPPMEETISHYGNVLYPPGSRIEYSNLAYGVLGHIIARTSGMSYAEFMRRDVFIPLGMTRTSVDVGPGMEAHVAVRYGTDGVPLPFYGSDTPGAAAVFSSAHDLIRFGLFHLQAHLPDQKPILNDASIEAMQRRTSNGRDRGGAEYGFGVGFMVSHKNQYKLVSHGGGMSGVTTQLYLIPEQGIAIAALSNIQWGSAPFDVADRIAAAVLPNWPVEPPVSRPAPTPAPYVTPPELAGTWRGILATYQGDIPLELKFAPGGEVHAQLGEQLVALVNDPSFDARRRRFYGRFAARIGTPDTERFAYLIDISLDVNANTLTGLAQTAYWQTGFATEARMRNSLAHWVRLERQ